MSLTACRSFPQKKRLRNLRNQRKIYAVGFISISIFRDLEKWLEIEIKCPAHRKMAGHLFHSFLHGFQDVLQVDDSILGMVNACALRSVSDYINEVSVIRLLDGG